MGDLNLDEQIDENMDGWMVDGQIDEWMGAWTT